MVSVSKNCFDLFWKVSLALIIGVAFDGSKLICHSAGISEYGDNEVSPHFQAAMQNIFSLESPKLEPTSRNVPDRPVIHIVFDISSEILITTPRRHLLNLLQFSKLPSDTYMTISTFSGPITNVGPNGRYLNKTCDPLSVIANRTQLISFLQTTRANNQTSRDTGLALKEAAEEAASHKYRGGTVVYLVSASLSDGSSVSELDVLDALVGNHVQVIGAELVLPSAGGQTSFDGVTSATGGFHFRSNSSGWDSVNLNAAEKLSTSINTTVFTRKGTFSHDHLQVGNDDAVPGVYPVAADRGVDNILSIQSTKPGVVTVTLTEGEIGYMLGPFRTSGRTDSNSGAQQSYLEAFGIADNMVGAWQYSFDFMPQNTNDVAEVTISVISAKKNTQLMNSQLGNPAIHVVIDISADIAITTPKRYLLNLLQFYKLPNTTYMTISTFSGPSTNVGANGKYLTKLCDFLNVYDNRTALISLLQGTRVNAQTTRDSGLALREAAEMAALHKDAAGTVIYLVSASLNSGSSVKELDTVDLLLTNRAHVVGVELISGSANQQTNLDGVIAATDGVHFKGLNMSEWDAANIASSNQLIVSAGRPIYSIKTTVIKEEHKQVTGSGLFGGVCVVPNDLGVENVLVVQSNKPGVISITLVGYKSVSQIVSSFSTTGRTSWNAPNINRLFVQSFNIPHNMSEQWNYMLEFTPQVTGDRSDVTVHFISGQNGLPSMQFQPRFWTTQEPGNGLCKHPLVTLFAQVETADGPLIGLNVTAQLVRNGFETTTVELTAEPSLGAGIYVRRLVPTSSGSYFISAQFRALATCTTVNSDESTGLIQNRNRICPPGDLDLQLPNATQISVKELDPSCQLKPTLVEDLELVYQTDAGSNLEITLSWTAPKLAELYPLTPAALYEIKYSFDAASLLEDFDNCAEIVLNCLLPAVPEVRVVAEATVRGEAGNQVYFAVRPVGINNLKGTVSNIVYSATV